jgi:hypothetical protein
MIRIRRRPAVLAAVLAIGLVAAARGDVPVALAMRLGTLGAGSGQDGVGSAPPRGTRAYSGFSLDHIVTEAELAYRRALPLVTRSLPSGAEPARPVPTGATPEAAASRIDPGAAELRFRDAAEPHVVIGWGNAVPRGQHWSLLADLGLAPAPGTAPGTRAVTTCAAAVAATCSPLPPDGVTERVAPGADPGPLRRTSMVTFGAGYRF